MTKTPKRPRDANQLAHAIIELAASCHGAPDEPAKVVRARKAGSKGGPARAQALTPAQRSEIAHIAAQARWKKSL